MTAPGKATSKLQICVICGTEIPPILSPYNDAYTVLANMLQSCTVKHSNFGGQYSRRFESSW